MHPLSDKDLDRLSREAAEQYDVDQNTSGWEQLEQKLNKHLPEKGRKERRRFLFFIWLLALLSGGGLLWMLTGNHSPQLITLKQGSKEISRTPSENKTTDQTLVENNTKKDNDTKKDTNNSDRPDNETTDRPLSVPDYVPPVGNKKNASVPQQNTGKKGFTPRSQKPDLNSKNLSTTDKDGRGNKSRLAINKEKNNLTAPIVESSRISAPADQSGKQADKNLTASNDSKPQKDQKDVASPLKNQPLPNANQSITDSAKQSVAGQIKSDDTSSSTKKVTTPTKKSGFKKGFQVGVIAAPDMSNVKFTNTDKVGFNVGIQIGYRISPRWSVNTGAIYTRKNYTSQGKDFNPPKGSWLDNVKLDEVEGNCFMFDIPLNVRYDLNTGNNHRYFLSTGLSTYLMKKEDYHYYYRYSNGNPGYRHRSYPSSEHHWLSILNISAGFEKKLSNRLSLQAEPYLKIPLSGVGYGNLKLNSYGMYFALKFGNTNKR